MLEYNVRFGDPECQVIVPRLTSDLTELLAQAAAGSIRHEPTFGDDAMVTVVCAAADYPNAPRTGDVISGIEDAAAIDGVDVFCAGVGRDRSGNLVTAGGRVLDVCGRGPTIAAARAIAYAGVERISWDGLQYRTDIGARAAARG
jgi:phosphoribosylamine--glycine ligase